MAVNVVGGGPGGLYASHLVEKPQPAWRGTISERNQPDVTYGWGIGQPERIPSGLREADRPSSESIQPACVQRDPVEIVHR